ncbi:divergent polysaccharide deacetylase family protein [Alkaliphilus hydrothermalis]|uniref:Polysaccharide deacetylase 2 family uncharacterized protein YibQ n=1 Tax=Alkaliphilus hydrothermalis TaxID=1482730 RepID=A0ABS2NMH9_9FIRM|nr:divergent polysaccharide deacetylase family protein [Alkaliphilus hydrothermalis]MBM7614126.1 polysaccharide deacetylase 2 family uncharacterized protein YibQ [Alkaliphilus hydrothermalis]
MFLVIRKKTIITLTLIIVVLSISLLGVHFKDRWIVKVSNPQPVGYVAIIIDDFGNSGEGTDEMLELEIPITAAVMPFLPHSQVDAEAAHKAGHEVIMHIPMEPVRGNPNWLGEKGITTDLSNEEIKSRICEGLEELRWAVGMNNHMGSKATQDKRVMESILQIAKEKNMFFVDSVTTQHSVVGQVSKNMEVTSLKRDVFLDNSKNQNEIEKQLMKLGEIALKKGYAIGIGHVGPEGGIVTVNAIKAMYPELKKKGIVFVYISQLKDLPILNR